MELLNMPIEMIRAVIESTIKANGMNSAMAMRLVCKTFDLEVIRAICAIKALDIPGYDHRHYTQRLYFEYLLARTTSDDRARNHHLSQVIYETVDYILQESPQDTTPRLDYVRSLCLATVQGCQSVEVMKLVNPGYPSPRPTLWFECSLEENALAATAALGITPLFQQLVKNGVRSAKTYFGRPLDCTARRGDLEMTRFLLEEGFTMVDSQELGHAARNGHGDVVKLLLDPKYNNADPSTNYNSAICKAATGGHQDIISLIMPWQDIKAHGDLLDAILQSAALHGQAEVARTVLDHGANCNTMRHPTSLCVTPLDGAAKNGHLAVVRLLLSRGAKLRPRRQSNPLIHAIKGGWLDIAQVLIDHGATVNPKTSIKEPYPTNPWKTAAIHGQSDMLRLLIKNGADVNADPNVQRDAYSRAAARGYTTIMSILAECAVDGGRPSSGVGA